MKDRISCGEKTALQWVATAREQDCKYTMNGAGGGKAKIYNHKDTCITIHVKYARHTNTHTHTHRHAHTCKSHNSKTPL